MSERRAPIDLRTGLGQYRAGLKASASPPIPTSASPVQQTAVKPAITPITPGNGTTSDYAPLPTPPRLARSGKRPRAQEAEPTPKPKPKPFEPIFPDPSPASNPLRRQGEVAVVAGLGVEALALVRREIDLETLIGDSAPSACEAGAVDEVIERITVGAEVLSDQPEPDELGFIVGFDFGTSCSKIVIHQPGAGELSYALPVPPHLRARELGVAQEHLWQTVVWFTQSSGQFSLEPVAGAVRLEGFKTGLIQSDGHRMVNGVTHAQATTAYLALLTAYTLGFHKLAAPPGFNRAAHFSRFHFGVPVACKDEGGPVREFSRALTAAFELAPYAPDIGLRDVAETLRSIAPEVSASATTPFLQFEELAGVIAGYRASPDARGGPHVVVDVGASTLDVATFSILNGDDGAKVPVYMSAVGLLGAAALKVARKKGVSDETFSLACNQHTRHVISHTFLCKNPSFFPMNGVPKPLLFVGGGRLTDVHERLYQQYPAGLEAPLVTPLPGPNLQYDEDTDFARLLLAPRQKKLNPVFRQTIY